MHKAYGRVLKPAFSAGLQRRSFARVQHNFNPGPGVLPKEVELEFQKNFVDHKGLGLGVVNMSHREKYFQDIVHKMVHDFRQYMKIPDHFKVMFPNGGIHLQFAALPHNLTGHMFGEPHSTANYLLSGYWTQIAAAEAAKYHNIHQVNTQPLGDKYAHMSKEEAIQASILDVDNWELDPNGKYFHMCNNETISGYQFDQKLMKQMIDKVKSVQNDPIISCDMSSVIGSQDLTKDGLSWDDFGVVYAGASKNFGHAGICFLIVRDDVLRHAAEVTKRSKLPMPVMMDW